MKNVLQLSESERAALLNPPEPDTEEEDWYEDEGETWEEEDEDAVEEILNYGDPDEDVEVPAHLHEDKPPNFLHGLQALPIRDEPAPGQHYPPVEDPVVLPDRMQHQDNGVGRPDAVNDYHREQLEAAKEFVRLNQRPEDITDCEPGIESSNVYKVYIRQRGQLDRLMSKAFVSQGPAIRYCNSILRNRRDKEDEIVVKNRKPYEIIFRWLPVNVNPET